MLYELLAGKPAFQADSAVEVMHAIVAEDPPELPDERARRAAAHHQALHREETGAAFSIGSRPGLRAALVCRTDRVRRRDPGSC